MHLLVKGARNFGLELTSAQLRAFEVYYQELKQWNPKANLTAIMDCEEVQLKHFLDSLSIYCLDEFREALRTKPSLRVLDLGTGAGFPGIPIKIISPSIKLTLLDSTHKKIRFLKHIVQRLELEGVEIIWGRAEAVAHQQHHRESYDFVVARAVAEMPILAEYTLPFCKVGGYVVAYKGPKASREVEAAKTALSLLGGKLLRLHPVELKGLHEARSLVLLVKVSPTLSAYPRRPGIPEKRPLGVKVASSQRTLTHRN
ncbi:MAG: 16S rRNA (guanine(527)-N(7))-methyltransferase RsmG [Chloroflexi bacterium]|nr:MAG: 16S rRNA (guanine(527)-N(7))-methyltransferase RsmG [Chloroflexota bacterium]HDN79769.1 16S rRNA (guanine(527)-N(7))-methyltransferase RsmG [Chloroflexota bacterium]